MPAKCPECGWRFKCLKYKVRETCPACNVKMVWEIEDDVTTKHCQKCNKSFPIKVVLNNLCPFCRDKTIFKVGKITAHPSVFGYEKRAPGSFETGKR